MNNCKLPYLLTLLTLLSSAAFSKSRQSIEPPAQLRNAAKAYKVSGAHAFLPSLFRKQLASGSKSNALSKNNIPKTNILKTVEKIYGNYVGLEMVDIIRVSKSIQLVFFILKYQRGPLYGVITTYQSNKGERIIGFKINTEIGEIIPMHLLGLSKLY